MHWGHMAHSPCRCLPTQMHDMQVPMCHKPCGGHLPSGIAASSTARHEGPNSSVLPTNHMQSGHALWAICTSRQLCSLSSRVSRNTCCTSSPTPFLHAYCSGCLCQPVDAVHMRSWQVTQHIAKQSKPSWQAGLPRLQRDCLNAHLTPSAHQPRGHARCRTCPHVHRPPHLSATQPFTAQATRNTK